MSFSTPQNEPFGNDDDLFADVSFDDLPIAQNPFYELPKASGVDMDALTPLVPTDISLFSRKKSSKPDYLHNLELKRIGYELFSPYLLKFEESSDLVRFAYHSHKVFSHASALRHSILKLMCRRDELHTLPDMIRSLDIPFEPRRSDFEDVWKKVQSEMSGELDLRMLLTQAGYLQHSKRVCPFTFSDICRRIAEGTIHASTHTDSSGRSRISLDERKNFILVLRDGKEVQAYVLQDFKSLSLQFDYYELENIRNGTL